MPANTTRSTPILVRIDNQELPVLDQVATTAGLNRSEFVRRAVRQAISSIQPKPT